MAAAVGMADDTPSSAASTTACSSTFACFFCDRHMCMEKYVWCVCPTKGGTEQRMPCCKGCVRRPQTKCFCGRTFDPLQDLKTPSKQFKKCLYQAGIRPSTETLSAEDEAGAVAINDAKVCLVIYHNFEFRYKLYKRRADFENGARQGAAILQQYTGVAFAFDSSECRLKGELACSPWGDFNRFVPTSWKTAWACSKIRWLTGLLNDDHVRRLDGHRLSEKLMRRGIMPGTVGLGMVNMERASHVVVAKEGPWTYFYCFESQRQATAAMQEWSWTGSILYRRRSRGLHEWLGEVSCNAWWYAAGVLRQMAQPDP